MQRSQADSMLRRAGWDIARTWKVDKVLLVKNHGPAIRKPGDWGHVATKPGNPMAILYVSSERQPGGGREVEWFEVLPAKYVSDMSMQGMGTQMRSLRAAIRLAEAAGQPLSNS